MVETRKHQRKADAFLVGETSFTSNFPPGFWDYLEAVWQAAHIENSVEAMQEEKVPTKSFTIRL